MVQWTSSSLEDATWEDFDSFYTTYELLNLEDKVVFGDGDNVTNGDPAQEVGPVILDQEVLKEHAHTWIREEDHNQQEGNEGRSEEEEAQEEETAHNRTGAGEQARGQRKHVRPQWLKEFVRMERS